MSNISKEKKEAILSLYHEGFKECTYCKEVKPLTDFYSIQPGVNLIPFCRECKECNSIIGKIYYQKIKNYILQMSKKVKKRIG